MKVLDGTLYHFFWPLMHLSVEKLSVVKSNRIKHILNKRSTTSCCCDGYYGFLLHWHFETFFACSINDCFPSFDCSNTLRSLWVSLNVQLKNFSLSFDDCRNFPMDLRFKSIADLKVSDMILFDEFWNSSPFVRILLTKKILIQQIFDFINDSKLRLLHWLPVWHVTWHYGSLPTSSIQCGDHMGYGALMLINIVYGTWSNMVVTMVTDWPWRHTGTCRLCFMIYYNI